MIGSDVLSDVDQWESFDELVKLAPPIVVDRLGHERGRRSFIPAVSSSEIRSAMAADQAQRVADMLVPTHISFRQDILSSQDLSHLLKSLYFFSIISISHTSLGNDLIYTCIFVVGYRR